LNTKIFVIPVIVVLAAGLFYWFMVENGYSPYYEGISIELYSDYQWNEFQKYPENQELPVTKITDEDLVDTPELKKLIEKALSTEYPLNSAGRTPITFEQLDKFQNQYAEILSEKYSRNSTSFFSTDDRHMPEKFLVIDESVHLRSFEGNYFEYKDVQYGIQPDTFYVPFMENEEHLRLEVYKTNGPLRSDHTWADLTGSEIEIIPQIEAAIAVIGAHQENIRLQTSGLSPSTMNKYKNWQDDTLEGFLFKYEGKIFSIGFWIA